MNRLVANSLDWLHKIEDALIAVLVVLLVGLAGAQIVLRNFFDSGMPWADPLLRAMVLWIGLLGALAAVREDKHISLDVLPRLLSGNALRLTRIVTLGFASFISGLVAWLSVHLIQIELEGATNTIVGIPSWFLEMILPVAFGLMSLRFALRIFVLPKGPHLPAGIPEDIDPISPPSRS